MVFDENLVGIGFSGRQMESQCVIFGISVESRKDGSVSYIFSSLRKEYFLGRAAKLTRTSPLMKSSCLPLILRQFLE